MRDETKIPYKENALLKNRLALDAFELASERIGHGVSEIKRQGSGADGRAIVKLNVSSLAGRAQLAGLLQICDGIDECSMRPGFRDTLCLSQGNHVCRGLFYDAEAVELQLTNYAGLSRTGCASQYKSFHCKAILYGVIQNVPAEGSGAKF
jgi:hypothetical protein